MDSHHDDRLNRPTGSFTSPGKLLAPAPGVEPGTAAVRSGACKMIRYTLRAGNAEWNDGIVEDWNLEANDQIVIFFQLAAAKGCVT